jgi:hypothetical protein
VPGPADNLFMDLRYMRGFIQMQNLLERALIKIVDDMKSTTAGRVQNKEGDEKQSGLKTPIVYLQQFPYPKYKSEE